MIILNNKNFVIFTENGVLNKLNVRRTKSSLDEISQNELLQKYFTTLILTVYNIVHNVTLELKQLVIFLFVR